MFTGAITALATPMKDDGAVDLESLRRLVEWQIAGGIDGLAPCGTTGEAATLNKEEWSQVIRTVVEQANGRVPVIAGAGANSTRVAVENSVLAREAGADGLLHVTPFYNKPTPDGLVAHFQAVAEAADLPVVVYNVPGRTSCDMLPETVARVARLPGVCGIKEATGSLQRAQALIAACPADFDVFSGDDFTCLGMTAMGGRGVISVIANLMPGEISRMIRLGREQQMEQARAIHYRCQGLMNLLFVEANPIPVKAALSLMGFTANHLRLPLLPLSGKKLATLRSEMANLGLLS